MEIETFKPSEKSRSGTTKNLQSPAEKSANRQTILPQIAKLNVTIFPIRPRKTSSLWNPSPAAEAATLATAQETPTPAQ